MSSQEQSYNTPKYYFKIQFKLSDDTCKDDTNEILKQLNEKLEKEALKKEEAIKEKEICCITHDILTDDNICVIGCGHVMSVAGFVSLKEKNIDTCPICRAKIDFADCRIERWQYRPTFRYGQLNK